MNGKSAFSLAALVAIAMPLLVANWGGEYPELPRRITGETDEARAERMARFREFMFAQVRELLTGYDKIDIIWYDFTIKDKFGKTYKKEFRGLSPFVG